MKKLTCSLLSLILILVCVTSYAATIGETNALKSANDYLSFTHFSYNGLIKQLEFEGYSASECQYAVDHCGADWYEQAAGSANDYLSFTSFSKSGLISQLEYEGFTKEEAEYGTAVAFGENPKKPGVRNSSSSSVLDSVAQAEPQEETKNANGLSPEPAQPAETVSVGKDFDLSMLSFDELKALQQKINQEMISRPEFKQVLVPVGAYKVGVDIPAGKWTITATEGSCEVYWGKELDEYGVKIPIGKRIDTMDDWGTKSSVTWELTEGTYIVVNRKSVTFTPYVPVSLGF